jgi:hypothetical protein
MFLGCQIFISDYKEQSSTRCDKAQPRTGLGELNPKGRCGISSLAAMKGLRVFLGLCFFKVRSKQPGAQG